MSALRALPIAAQLSAAALLAVSANAATLPVAESSGDDALPASVSERPEGLVIGYGTIVEPPYVFEGAGKEVRFLNGLQYYPQPYSAVARDVVVVSDEMREQSSQRWSLQVSIREQTKSIADVSAKLHAMRDLFQASSLVEHVEMHESSLEVKWKDSLVREIVDAIPRGGLRSADEPYNEFGAQDSMVSLFWSTIGRGDAVAFGDDYIVFGGDPQDPSRIRLIISELREGRHVSRKDIEETLLDDSKILKSVLEAANRDQSAIIDQ